MALIVWADVLATPGTEVCARLDNLIAQAMFLGVANAHFNPEMFDGEASETYRLVRCLYVGHLCTVASQGSQSGPIRIEEAFRVRTEYGINPSQLGATQFTNAIDSLASVQTRLPLLLRSQHR